MSIRIIKNDRTEIVEIEGIKYSYDLFKKFGHEMPLDTLMVITEREGGVICVKVVEPGDVFKFGDGTPYKMPLFTAPPAPLEYLPRPKKARLTMWQSTLAYFRRLVG